MLGSIGWICLRVLLVLFELEQVFYEQYERESTMKSREGTPNEGTQGTDKEKEVRSRGGSPRPLQTHQITSMGRLPEHPETPVEYVAEMARRELTRAMTPEPSEPSDDEYKEWKAKREEITKGKKRAGTPDDERQKKERLKTDIDEQQVSSQKSEADQLVNPDRSPMTKAHRQVHHKLLRIHKDAKEIHQKELKYQKNIKEED